ncbi:Similar to AP-1 complex subunit sigma-1; acc. no. Q9P7N2 [Pyronema omphalodes CBS 100304]|nr:Similar to AP-1 complex subunit sigma-1; acc. no. Q9P7N2 [Pyronema omphalodes CBS 100304]
MAIEQGKVRLAKWFNAYTHTQKEKLIRDVTSLVLSSKKGSCSFIDYKDSTITHRRYASLHIIVSSSPSDNPLLTLEILHRYIESLDQYFGDVCELDIIFGIEAAYAILDELLMAGELQETEKERVVKTVKRMDRKVRDENDAELERHLRESGYI